jgi:hypothetical protein
MNWRMTMKIAALILIAALACVAAFCTSCDEADGKRHGKNTGTTAEFVIDAASPDVVFPPAPYNPLTDLYAVRFHVAGAEGASTVIADVQVYYQGQATALTYIFNVIDGAGLAILDSISGQHIVGTMRPDNNPAKTVPFSIIDDGTAVEVVIDGVAYPPVDFP